MSAFLQNWPVKVLGGTGVYLSEAHSPPMTPYPPPLHTVYTVQYVYTVLYTYSHREMGRRLEGAKPKTNMTDCISSL